MSRRRLLVVEEPLRDYYGHFFEYARMLAESNRRTGVEVDVAVHRDAQPAVLAALGATPVFRYTTWDDLYRGGGIRRWRNYALHGWRTLRDLRRFLRGRERYDLVYVATVTAFQLPAWRMLLALDAGRRFRQLVLHIRLGWAKYPESSAEPVFKKKVREVAGLLRSFEGHEKAGTVRFVSDSRRLAAEIRQLCDLELEVLPHPVEAGEAGEAVELAAVERSPHRVVLSALGPARREKGTLLIQRAIRRIFEVSPDFPARFVLHWGGRVTDPLLERDPVLEADARVEFLDYDLGPEEYRRRLLASDCILVPYRREQYAARISGVALEAAVSGIPTIYTRDTWLEDAATQWGCGLGIEDGEVEDLAEKIRILASNVEKYRATARERAPLARRYHSPENHRRLLWGDPDGTPA